MTENQKTAVLSTRLYVSLLKEVDGGETIWKHAGRAYTAAEMIREIEESSDVAVNYARLLLHGTIKGIMEKTSVVIPPAAELDVSVPISATLAEYCKKAQANDIIWRAMSKTWYAGEMPELLEKRDPDTLSFVSDVLRIVRGWLQRGVVRK